MSDSDMPSHHGPAFEPEGEYPNETMRLLFKRASCRDYSDQEVSPEVLKAVLEVGTHAPTGGNLQPYSIIKIENEANRRWFVVGMLRWLFRQFLQELPVVQPVRQEAFQPLLSQTVLLLH